MPAPRQAMRMRTTRRILTRRMIMRTITVITMTTVMTMVTVMVTATITTIISMTSIARTSMTTVIPMLMTTNEPRPIPDRGGMTDAETAALYRLMTWLSPSFPVGAFAYSSGIEWAVEAGDITDAAALRDWLAVMLADGSGFCDAVFLAQAHRAAEADDDHHALREIAELAAAYVPSRERQLETTAQGRAFIEIARAAWTCDGLDLTIASCGETIVYPVAVGIVSAAHAIPLVPTLHAFLHALVSNWISAGSRLIPLGQTDSQRVLAALEPVVAATAGRAMTATLDDLGSATFRADLSSLRHEAQYTRLFRS
jgi:urease accessory protein